MCHRVNVSDCVLVVVQKNVRISLVAAGRECAGIFSLVLIAVSPSVQKSVAESVGVIFSKDGKRVSDNLHGFLIGDVALH